MKLTNFKTITGSGALVAKFDIEFKPLTVRGFGLFEKSDGGRWISEPSTKFTGKDGTVKYHKHVDITDENIKGEIERLAKIAYETALYGAPPSDDQEIPF